MIPHVISTSVSFFSFLFFTVILISAGYTRRDRWEKKIKGEIIDIDKCRERM